MSNLTIVESLVQLYASLGGDTSKIESNMTSADIIALCAEAGAALVKRIEALEG